MSSPNAKGVARAMYSDSLRFFEEAISNLSTAGLHRPIETQSQYEERIEARDDFKVRLTTTHAIMMMFKQRYPEAVFTFHSERNRLPNVSDGEVTITPLRTQAITFTVDFEPYGTMFGGSSDDDGGNATSAFGQASTGPSSPRGPSGPSTRSSVATPA